jgi:hypothetical protein
MTWRQGEGTAKIVYSADGQTRAVTSTGTNSKGEKISAIAVYDKQCPSVPENSIGRHPVANRGDSFRRPRR